MAHSQRKADNLGAIAGTLRSGRNHGFGPNAALVAHLAIERPVWITVYSGGKSLQTWTPCRGENEDDLHNWFIKSARRLGACAAAIGAEKGERVEGRLSYRSGYYPRSLITRVGKLELRVPQDRNGRFSTEIFERYQRSEKALLPVSSIRLPSLYLSHTSA